MLTIRSIQQPLNCFFPVDLEVLLEVSDLVKQESPRTNWESNVARRAFLQDRGTFESVGSLLEHRHFLRWVALIECVSNPISGLIRVLKHGIMDPRLWNVMENVENSTPAVEVAIDVPEAFMLKHHEVDFHFDHAERLQLDG